MRLCLVKLGAFDFESVGDGANEPARVLNLTFIVWLQKNGGILGGYPGGERVLDQYLDTGLKPGAFSGQKILKYKPCVGQHSPRLVLKSFISNCNIEQIHVIVISFVYCLVVQTITNLIKQVKP